MPGLIVRAMQFLGAFFSRNLGHSLFMVSLACMIGAIFMLGGIFLPLDYNFPFAAVMTQPYILCPFLNGLNIFLQSNIFQHRRAVESQNLFSTFFVG